jgi:hypothetical protein
MKGHVESARAVADAASPGSSDAEDDAPGESRSVDGALQMTRLIVAVAAAIALAVIAVMVSAWEALGDVEMSTAGWVALVAGGVLTFAVGAGLMVLIFYSNRAGYDEPPQTWPANDEDRQEAEEFGPPRGPPSPAKRQTGSSSDSSSC